MADLTDFGMDVPDTPIATAGSDHFRKRDCRAVVDTSGRQCTNNASNSECLCTVHQDANAIVRVDDFEHGPAGELRDELIEDCGISGNVAYKLATLASTASELWELLIHPDPIEVGDEVWAHDRKVLHCPDVARHPDLDVDSHLFAQGTCIALTGDGIRCPYGASGLDRICGVHRGADDIELLDEFADKAAPYRDS